MRNGFRHSYRPASSWTYATKHAARGLAGRVVAVVLAAALAHVAHSASLDSEGSDLRSLNAYRLLVPVKGVARSKLRDSFSEPRGGHRHEALDIVAPRGTPVVAVGDGRVAKLFKSAAGGLTIYQVDPEGRFAYYYAHLDGYAPDLREGRSLKRGELLGYVGTSGNAPPQTPHLHFAIFRLGADRRWWAGTPINPYAYLNDD